MTITITNGVGERQVAMELQRLRSEQDALGDRLAWAKQWDADYGGHEMIDAVECIQQAIETVDYAARERDDALREYNYRLMNGPEIETAHNVNHPYAA